MVYRFLILSDEVDDFRLEIQIDAEATFLELQDAMLDAVGYRKDQMTSFFLCDDEWNKGTEVTLMEMDTSSEMDNYVMADTKLEELLEEELQRLLFIFDNLTDRAFFMELREIITGKEIDSAICSRNEGIAPMQILDVDVPSATAVAASAAMLDDDFYGDSEYDEDELGGFESIDNLDEGSFGNPYEGY